MIKTKVAFLEGRLLPSQSEQFKKYSKLPNQSEQFKKYLKRSDWLEKASPPKTPLLF